MANKAENTRKQYTVNSRSFQTASARGFVGNVELGQAGDTPVLEFGLAHNYQRGDNEYTQWVDCKLFGPLAEKIGINKGDLVQVDGRLQIRTWGEPERTSVEIIVDNIDVIARPA